MNDELTVAGLSLLLLAALLSPGCATPEPVTLRHADFRPAEIRRPAVVLQVSLEHTGFVGEGEFSSRERGSVPDAFEVALLDGLNAEGILPVDVTVAARRSSRPGSAPFEGIDQGLALQRARALNADVLLILDASLSRQDLIFCREERRPFVARTTLWTLGAKVLRATDGARLLVEPRVHVGDIEANCERGRIDRRLSTQELLDAAVGRGLSLMLGK